MSTPVKLTLYLFTLIALFIVGLGLGTLVGPLA